MVNRRIHYTPRTQVYTVNITRGQRQAQTQKCCHSTPSYSSGFSWASLASMITALTTMFSAFSRPSYTPTTSSMAQLSGAQPKTDDTPTQVTSETASKTPAATQTTEVEQEDDGKGAVQNYDVEEIPQDFETYTIKAQKQADGKIKGDTWASLALSKYNIQGVSLKDVYTALAKANYTGDNFEEAMKKGIQFNAGDQIKLPKELNINGKKVTLKEDWQTTDTRFSYNTAKSDYRSATVEQVGSKWRVVKSDTREQVGELYDTKEAAEAAVATLKNPDGET